MRDFYKILDVPRNASTEEIKKAYRKLAFDLHPDRRVGDKDAEVKFKEVQEAYDVLGDEAKRARYDNPYHEPQGFTDIFDAFFSQRPRQKDWGLHIEIELVIDFLESATGCTKELNYDRRECCQPCKGTGAKDGKEFKQCVVCDGKGKTYFHHQNFGSYMRMESVCQSCKGSGKVINIFCDECGAKGYHLKNSSLEVKVPAGINDGMKIRIRGEGDVGTSGTGDLFCLVRVKPHPLFQREGINLFLKMPVGYARSVLGGEIDVPCLEGSCKFKLPPLTRSGTTFRMPGLGFNIPDGDESIKGDLLVKVLVEVPEVNSDQYREILEKLHEMEEASPGEMRREFKEKL